MEGNSELQTVAFRYEGEKYCRQCFYDVTPLGKQVRFLAIPRGLQRTSCVQNCFKCGKDLIKDYNG